MRTHRCGIVDESLLDQEVTLCGWVNRRRDHGGVILLIYVIAKALYKLSLTLILLRCSALLNQFVMSIFCVLKGL